jgi:ribulose kinase
MNIVLKIFLSAVFSLTCVCAKSQNNLNIESIFLNYGKSKGAALVELAQDVLGNHTHINRYKSLTIPSDTGIISAATKAIEQDLKHGEIMLENKKDGRIETGYYYMKKHSSADYEYILFTDTSRKITLIYIRGKFPPNQLEDELNKLKDLFIKVNNKRVKL